MKISIAKQRGWTDNHDGTWFKPIKNKWSQIYREYKCKQCNEIFVADRKGIFCSISCSSKTQPKGPKNPLWKGGIKRYKKGSKRKHAAGYIEIWDGKRWIGEHRIIMEQRAGRKLDRYEHVHHINGIKNDNRPENLIILTIQQHNSIHKTEQAKTAKRDRHGRFS